MADKAEGTFDVLKQLNPFNGFTAGFGDKGGFSALASIATMGNLGASQANLDASDGVNPPTIATTSA